MTRLTLALVALCALPYAPPARADGDADLRRWIAALGDRAPATREAAQRDLLEHIDRARPLLRQHADDADSERKARVARLLTIAGWLDDLGARRYATREAASRKLQALGPPIIPALRRRLSSDDEEIRARARSLLTALGWTSDATAREIAGLLKTLRDGGAAEARVFGYGALTDRHAAMRKLLLLPTGRAQLERLFAERAGTLDATITLPDTVTVGKPVTAKLALKNAGKSGLWIRRGVSASVRFESLRCHVQLVPRTGRRTSRLIFGGRRAKPANPLDGFAYLAPGRTLRYQKQATPGGFGRVVASVHVRADKRDAKGVAIPTDAADLTLHPNKTPFERTAYRLAFPAPGPTAGGLELTVADPTLDAQSVAVRARLHNRGKTPLTVLVLSDASKVGLYWFLRRDGALAGQGWFTPKGSRVNASELAAGPGATTTLAAGAHQQVALRIPRPAKPGTYQLQIGLGPVTARLAGDDKVWTGELVSRPLAIVVGAAK